MNSPEANKIIEKIISETEKKGVSESLISMMQELRPFALREEDPLLTRSIRIAYEYIEADGGFDIPMPEEAEVEGEDAEKLVYLCNLWLKSDNKYNRDEIRDITNSMTNSY